MSRPRKSAKAQGHAKAAASGERLVRCGLTSHYAKAAEIIAKHRLAEKISGLWVAKILVRTATNEKDDPIKDVYLSPPARHRSGLKQEGDDWEPRISAEDLYSPVDLARRHVTIQRPRKRYRIERDKFFMELVREAGCELKKPRRGRREDEYALAAVAQLSDLYARFHLGARQAYTHDPISDDDSGPFLEAVRLIFEAAGLRLTSSGYAKRISTTHAVVRVYRSGNVPKPRRERTRKRKRIDSRH